MHIKLGFLEVLVNHDIILTSNETHNISKLEIIFQNA